MFRVGFGFRVRGLGLVETSRSPGTPLQNNLDEFYTCCQFLAHSLDDEVYPTPPRTF